MENKNTNEELEYFCNKLKETMGKGLPKKYLETTDLGEVDKEYGHRFKERIEKHLTEVDKIKNMIDDNLKNETPTFGNVLLPVVLLDEIIKYIEETEKTIDGEWGSGRSVEKLIEHNCMPELYAKMTNLKTTHPKIN
jgi:thymidylate synthase